MGKTVWRFTESVIIDEVIKAHIIAVGTEYRLFSDTTIKNVINFAGNTWLESEGHYFQFIKISLLMSMVFQAAIRRCPALDCKYADSTLYLLVHLKPMPGIGVKL